MQEATTSIQHGIRVAILPDVGTLLKEPLKDNPHCAAINRLINALDRIPSWAETQERTDAFHEADKAAQFLLEDIGRPPQELEVEPITAVQDYFNVRTARLDADECLVQVATVVAMVIFELGHGPMGGNDIDLFKDGLIVVLRQFVDDDNDRDRVVDLANETREIVEPVIPIQERWNRRWVGAHQIHAALHTFAAAAIRQAVGYLQENNSRAAIERIECATAYVDAIAPVRAMALNHPPIHYELVYRPSMLPPLASQALHGRLHPEPKEYHAAVNELLELVPAPVVELARVDLELALARERLLNSDIADTERHISLVWSMIGNKKALAQSTRRPDNALGALRGMRDRRAAQFAPYVRYSHEDHSYG